MEMVTYITLLEVHESNKKSQPLRNFHGQYVFCGAGPAFARKVYEAEACR